MNVGEALLNRAEDGNFGIVRKAFQILRHVEVCGNVTALRESINVPTERGNEPNFIEQRCPRHNERHSG